MASFFELLQQTSRIIAWPDRSTRRAFLFWGTLGGLSLGAGWGLAATGIPAAWFLGPMAVAGVMACMSTENVSLPGQAALVSQAIIGSVMSAALTPEALAVLLRSWLAILLVLVGLLFLTVVSGGVLSRLGQIDLTTAMLSVLPGGGPAGMSAVSDDLKGDTRLVALMQTMRVMLVIGSMAIVAAAVMPEASPGSASTVPTSAAPASSSIGAYVHLLGRYGVAAVTAAMGAWAGLRLRLPAGAMVGPALLGAVAGLLGVPHAEWPSFVLALSYAALGVSVGLRFDLQAFRATRRLVLPFLVCTLGIIGGAAMMGWVLVALTGTDWFSAYLATTPGGINIAVILALDSGANVTLVLGFSLVRFLLVMLAGPPLVRWLVRLTGTAPVPPPPPSHPAS
jgi:hypothetical protein